MVGHETGTYAGAKGKHNYAGVILGCAKTAFAQGKCAGIVHELELQAGEVQKTGGQGNANVNAVD